MSRLPVPGMSTSHDGDRLMASEQQYRWDASWHLSSRPVSFCVAKGVEPLHR